MVVTSSGETMTAGLLRQREEHPSLSSHVHARKLVRPPRATVGDVSIDRMSMEDTVHWVMERLRDRDSALPLQIMAANAQLVTLASANQQLGRAMRSSDMNIPDGISVVMAARLLGLPMPERVPGGELMERLCAAAAQDGFCVFFLGGLPGAAVAAAMQLKRRYPGLRVAGCYCPRHGFERDPLESKKVRRLISDAAPDILCVALGAPKQEIWMEENCSTLPIGAAIAVGAALDTTAGLRRRAPQWTHEIGMEWLYRLIHEPRRLWRRYLYGNTRFILLVGRQLIQQTPLLQRMARQYHS